MNAPFNNPLAAMGGNNSNMMDMMSNMMNNPMV